MKSFSMAYFPISKTIHILAKEGVKVTDGTGNKHTLRLSHQSYPKLRLCMLSHAVVGNFKFQTSDPVTIYPQFGIVNCTIIGALFTHIMIINII